jgi:DNA polymerase-3 subunit epsilon
MDGGPNSSGASDGGAAIVLAARPAPLKARISETERAAHTALVDGMGDKAIWKKYSA